MSIDHEVIKRLSRAIELLTRGDSELARKELQQIDPRQVWAIRTKRRADFPAPRRSRQKSKFKRRQPSTTLQRRVFERDSYACVYCGRRTVDLAVLKQINRVLPDALPYNPSWSPKIDHAIYWVYSTSLEHVTAVSDGGTNDENNLVATCYDCNDHRNDSDLEALGWKVRRSTSDWRGLAEHIPSLSRLAGQEATVKKPTSKTKQITSESTVADPKKGYLVRLKLPGKKSRSTYRVDSQEGEFVCLTEMWRQSAEKTWVTSKRIIVIRPKELIDVELISAKAPRVAS